MIIRAILFSFATMLGLGALILILAALFFASLAWPRDLDGRYANSPLKPWFNQLASKNGLCCSFADGVTVQDPDYGTEAVANGNETVIRYWVKLDGRHIVVPPDALITEPNRFGPAVVWPIESTYSDGHKEITGIRCFMPGAGT